MDTKLKNHVRSQHQHDKTVSVVLALMLIVFLSSCAGTPLSPQRPEISVAKVRPLSLSGQQQRFVFTLNIANPNAFSLPVEGVNLTANFGGEQVAVGQSTDAVAVPANGSAQLDVEITTTLKETFTNLLKNLGKGSLNLDYELTGDVKIKNVAKSFPFSERGNLFDPGT